MPQRPPSPCPAAPRPARPAKRVQTSAGAAALCGLGLLAAHQTAAAFPYQAERLTGSVLAGPTDGDLSALYYNPAALRLLDGAHLQITAGAQGFLGSYRRAAPLPAAFKGDGSAASPDAAVQWAAPISFAGVSWDLGSRSVTLALAFYTPHLDFTSYGGDSEGRGGVTRYHALRSQVYSLWGAGGAALRLTDWLFVGGVFNFGHTSARLRLFHDGRDGAAGQGQSGQIDQLPCGVDCERFAARQDLSLNVSGWGYGFSAGILVLPMPRLWIGVGYVSPLFTSAGAQLFLSDFPDTPVSATGQGDCQASQLPAWSGACLVSGDPSTGAVTATTGGAALLTALPHVIHLGVRYRLPAPASASPAQEARRPPFNLPYREARSAAVSGADRDSPRSSRAIELAGAVRLTLPPRSDQELRLERRAFPELPGSMLLPRGLQPAVALDLSARQLFPRLTLAQGLLYESPRASASAVSPANLEGHKLNLALTAQLNLSPSRWISQRLWLVASLGATLYLFGGDPGSGFRAPTEAAADGASWAAQCRDANLDLAAAACLRARDGWALPTASGDYRLLTLQGSLGLHVKL